MASGTESPPCCSPLLALAVVAGSAGAAEVNLYSYRQPFLIEPILSKFTEETGIEVNVVFAKKGMIDKIRAAGENNPADAVLTVDIGRLDGLVEAGLLEPVESSVLEATVPAALRHPDGLWFGLTTRARVVYAHKDRVASDAIMNTADLADPKLKPVGCARGRGSTATTSPSSPRSSPATARRRPRTGFRGVKANLARKPQGNDRAQAKAIHEGVCDVALANTYYMGKMATNEKKPEQKDWASVIRVHFLDQDGPGQHVNISGAGVIKGAKNRAASGAAHRVPRRRRRPADVREQQLRVSGEGGGRNGSVHRVARGRSGPTRSR